MSNVDYKELLVMAEHAEKHYECISFSMTGAELCEIVKHVMDPIEKLCKFIENERKQTEKKLWESVDLYDIGGVITSYFVDSPFCVYSQNYLRFNLLRKSLACIIHYNEQSAETKDRMDEISVLSCDMNSIMENVRCNEQYLKNSIVELNTPLYETYHGKIIYSGNTVCQIVVDFLGMSYFTYRADDYIAFKARHDYLLELME